MFHNVIQRSLRLLSVPALLCVAAISHSDTNAPTYRPSVPFGKIPLSFEANQGQTDKQVKFFSRGKGYSLFLTPTEAVFSLSRAKNVNSRRLTGGGMPQDEPGSVKIVSTALTMKLIGANPQPRMTGHETLPGKVNYFIGSDPKKWRTNVPTYSKILSKNVYPGIDLVYYGNQQQLEYDFIVSPGIDPAKIKLEFSGVKRLRVEKSGELTLQLVDGELRWHKPILYQTVNGVRKAVGGRYTVQGKNQIGFQIARYDKSKPLVIDPYVIYAAYLGVTGDDGANAVKADSAGNAYVVGFVPSTSNGDDVVVRKINSAGTVLYTTYFGGNEQDRGTTGMGLDSSGNVYVTGITTSTNLPMLNAYQSSLGGGSDSFLVKLSSTGSNLYSTYLGGSNEDRSWSVAIDNSGNAYLVGQTLSTNFPTKSAYQGSHKSEPNRPPNTDPVTPDCFVAKINPSLSGNASLVYSTYLGGWEEDVANDVAVDTLGQAYVTGRTASGPASIYGASYAFPTTSNRLHDYLSQTNPANQNNRLEAFVTKFNSSGSALLYSTFLGGSYGNETGEGIAVDGNQIAYVTGMTSSPQNLGVQKFPITPNACQPIYGGGYNDAFITKIDTTASTGAAALLYSTYFGGSQNPVGFAEEVGWSIAADDEGNAFVTGQTPSSDFPITSNAVHQPVHQGQFDAFLVWLDTTLPPPNPPNQAKYGLRFSTLIGGSQKDQPYSIFVDSAWNAWICGWTQSSSFYYPYPTPPSPRTALGSYGGGSDGFVAKFTLLPSVTGITISPGTVYNGFTALATVTLDRPAFSGQPALYAQSSLPGVAAVPTTIPLYEGDTTASFSINTFAVMSQTVVTISARVGADPANWNDAVSATITVNPTSITTLNPTADAYVNAGSSTDPSSGQPYANTNYGASPSPFQDRLIIKKVSNNSSQSTNRCTYIKFDLTGISTPAEAILKLHYYFASSPQSRTMLVDVFGSGVPADNTWTDGGITWNNAPGLDRSTFSSTWGSPLVDNAVVRLQEGVTTINLTSFIANNLNNSVTIQLIGYTAQVEPGVAFYSREAASSVRPVLVLRY